MKCRPQNTDMTEDGAVGDAQRRAPGADGRWSELIREKGAEGCEGALCVLDGLGRAHARFGISAIAGKDFRDGDFGRWNVLDGYKSGKEFLGVPAISCLSTDPLPAARAKSDIPDAVGVPPELHLAS